MHREFAARVLTCAMLVSTTTLAQSAPSTEPVVAAAREGNVSTTRAGTPPPARPAIIAEQGTPVAFTGKTKTKYYVVNNNIAYPVDEVEALALSGDRDAAWQRQVAPMAGAAVLTPFATVGILMMSFGAVGAGALGVVAIASLAPVTPVQTALGVGGGLGAALVGTGILLFGTWLSTWVADKINPPPEVLASLDNVQYIEAGTLPAVLAERHCVLEEVE